MLSYGENPESLSHRGLNQYRVVTRGVSCNKVWAWGLKSLRPNDAAAPKRRWNSMRNSSAAAAETVGYNFVLWISWSSHTDMSTVGLRTCTLQSQKPAHLHSDCSDSSRDVSFV